MQENFNRESNQNKDQVLKYAFYRQLHGLNLEKEILFFWEYLRQQNPNFKILDVGSGQQDSFLEYILSNKEEIRKNITADSDPLDVLKTNFESKNVIGLDLGMFEDDVNPGKSNISLEGNSFDIVSVDNDVMDSLIKENKDFERIITELLRVTADPGVCMFNLTSYQMCEDLIIYKNKDFQRTNNQDILGEIAKLEKRKVFLQKAFDFLQNLRDDGYCVNFFQLTKPSLEQIMMTETSFAVHITKNPEEYSGLQKKCLETIGNQDLKQQLYLKEYEAGLRNTYDYSRVLYPGAKTLYNFNT